MTVERGTGSVTHTVDLVNTGRLSVRRPWARGYGVGLAGALLTAAGWACSAGGEALSAPT